MEGSDRRVAKTFVGEFEISTVFLGLDHRFGEGRPLLFETMAFPKDSRLDLECDRYSTWEEAEKGHALMVKKYKRKKNEG